MTDLQVEHLIDLSAEIPCDLCEPCGRAARWRAVRVCCRRRSHSCEECRESVQRRHPSEDATLIGLQCIYCACKFRKPARFYDLWVWSRL